MFLKKCLEEAGMVQNGDNLEIMPCRHHWNHN